MASEKLYAIGGRRSGGPGGVFAPLIAEVDVYDFTTNTWSTLPPTSNLPTPRAAAAVAKFDNKNLVIGGEGNGRAYDTVEALDPDTNTWQILDSLNHARHGTQAIVSGEGVYVAAGSPNQGGGNQRNMEVFNADKPEGTASVAGVLSAPNNALFVGKTTNSIRLAHGGGNEGIFVTQVTLSGADSGQFALASSVANPFLIPVEGTRDLIIEYRGNNDRATASLDIAYSGTKTISIALAGQPIPEPHSAVLSLIAAISLMVVNRRWKND